VRKEKQEELNPRGRGEGRPDRVAAKRTAEGKTLDGGSDLTVQREEDVLSKSTLRTEPITMNVWTRRRRRGSKVNTFSTCCKEEIFVRGTLRRVTWTATFVGE